jgi:Histidine kinase-, DNA gyrase B-, and HSP90-like ATPase
MAIHLSPKFFKNERQNYSNWQLAIWRELFQNAVDQDATQIIITLAEGANGCVDLSFADNGPGMSRSVLKNVYFALGESTKDQDPTKIGGMGRARLLTCFSMHSYRIFSQDYEVASGLPAVAEGKDFRYSVHPPAVGSDCEAYDHAWTDGCKLVLEVDDTDLATMQQALDQFLYESRITARLYVNGTRVSGRSLNAGKHIRDLSVRGTTFARVWVNKSVQSKRVIMRVNGVSMFTCATNANAQITVELEPSISRIVLTANRDSLHYKYQEALNLFLSELAVDTTSALRSRFGRRTTAHRGGGMRTIHRNDLRRLREGKPVVKTAEKSAPYATPAPYAEPRHLDDRFIETIPLVEDFDSWLARTFGDIYVFEETDNLAVHKAAANYEPSNWITGLHKQKEYRRGGKIIRLLLLWHTAITYALEVAMPALQLTEIPFSVGFVLNPEHRADHRELDGGHVFSLNPVDDNGKLKYNLSDRIDLKRLRTLAKHEVTHVSVSWHGEAFSHLREEIDIAFDDGECLRRMKDALRRANESGSL